MPVLLQNNRLGISSSFPQSRPPPPSKAPPRRSLYCGGCQAHGEAMVTIRQSPLLSLWWTRPTKKTQNVFLNKPKKRNQQKKKMAAHISCLLCIDWKIFILYIYFLFNHVNSALNYSVVFSNGQAAFFVNSLEVFPLYDKKQEQPPS